MSITVTISSTREVTIEAKLRRKLQTKLQAYAGLVEQRKVLDHAIKKASDELGELRDETGEMSLKLDGYTITLVASTYKKFNPKKFVSLGGDLAIYNQAVEERPKKPYNKISLPGEKEGSEE